MQQQQVSDSPTENPANRFAFDLLNQLVQASGDADKNVFISPFSVLSAASALLLGSAGQSEAELKKALSLENVSNVPDHFREIQKSVLHAVKGVELSSANKLFPEQSYNIKEEFLTLVRNVFESDVQPLDFVQNAEGSRKIINDWVSEATKNKINDLLQPGTIKSNTKLVLANAIYFKGNWQDQFKKDKTIDGDFHVSPGKVVKTKFMKKKAKYLCAYDEGLKLQLLEIPYSGDTTSMVIALPTEKFGLGELETKFTAAKFREMETKYFKEEVMLSLPKFKMEYSSDLVDSFKGLGAKSIFGSSADFSKISCKQDLYVSAIAHKAFVEVNEEGTEAAAATAVVMARMALLPPNQFTCDHPFMFFIKHKPTNTILFMGRYVKPEE